MHSLEAQIEALRKQLAVSGKKLKKQEERASRAEQRALKAERRAAAAEQRAGEAEQQAKEAEQHAKEAEQQAKEAAELNAHYNYCFPIAYNFLVRCIKLSEEDANELFEVRKEHAESLAARTAEDLENSAHFRVLKCFHSWGCGKSEKPRRHNKSNKNKTSGKKNDNDKPAKPDDLVNDATPKNRSANRADKMMDAAAAAEKAAQEEAEKHPEDAKLAAARDIADLRKPVIQEEERKKSPGRQKVEATQDALQPSATTPSVCKFCGSSDIVYGAKYFESLRDFKESVMNLAAFTMPEHRAVHCNACGRSWEHIDGEVGVSPHRTVGMEVLTTIGTLNAMGLAVEKMSTLFGGSQLGNDTIGRNLDDWANQYGAQLVKALNKELWKQPVVVADETTFNVLQSKGLGPCAVPEETSQRQKDYVGVKCTPFNAERRIVLLHYLGGRSTEDIETMLEGIKAGTLVSDGYAAYNRICNASPDDLKHQNCLVHLRRQLLDALNIPVMDNLLFGSDVDRSVEIVKKRFEEGRGAPFYFCIVLSAISKIYGYEKEIKQGAEEPREAYLKRLAEHRRQNAAPAMKAIDTILSGLAEEHACLQNSRYVAKNQESLIDKAIVYYMNQRDSFHTFLTDPEVPPDSNVAEVSIRAVTVLRKATDFKQSQDSTKSLCIWLSLQETAAVNGIKDTVRWLTEFSRALYQHRADYSVAKELAEGRNINSKLMKFHAGSEAGFDVEPWLPWNYARRMRDMNQVP